MILFGYGISNALFVCVFVLFFSFQLQYSNCDYNPFEALFCYPISNIISCFFFAIFRIFYSQNAFKMYTTNMIQVITKIALEFIYVKNCDRFSHNLQIENWFHIAIILSSYCFNGVFLFSHSIQSKMIGYLEISDWKNRIEKEVKYKNNDYNTLVTLSSLITIS